MFSLYCVCLFPTALQELKVCRTDTYVIYPKHSKFMSIIIKDLSYTHTDKEVLFPTSIWLSIPEKRPRWQAITVAENPPWCLTALHAILNGDTAEEHFARLDNDWNIEERTQAVLHAWHLNGISLLRPLEGLSGGEKTRLFLAGMELKEPDTLLLDEPTNNLDIESIEIITATIRNYQGTVLAVSHDRDFLKETGIEQEISFFL